MEQRNMTPNSRQNVQEIYGNDRIIRNLLTQHWVNTGAFAEER